ncbi:ABC transporter ATP-binding protein [Gemmatimonas aurantiaca]|nr:ABC transporter ATP-binding protein [Gemmatimonas aurantiaca]
MILMENIGKTYLTGDVRFDALKDIHLEIKRNEFCAVVGPSGSGKSTLMNIMGCLDIPTGGEYFLNGNSVANMTQDNLADVRNQTIGFVFQAFNLLPYATAEENVEVPMLFAGMGRKERLERCRNLLERVGLSDKMQNRPTEMSGGEMQRVAIARSLANDPPLILADEPTGNLDSKTGHAIVDLFNELHSEGRTIIMITHDPSIAATLPRQIHMQDGALVEAEAYRAAS